jgi:drug/metabolite transporter (DMT)-like permease
VRGAVYSRQSDGTACALAAVSIWAGWSVFTRQAVTTNLDAWDIAALRFGVAGLLLSPVVIRRGLAVGRLGWPGLALLIAGLGAPYVLVVAAGLRFAPAADQGALNPGCMPFFVGLIAAFVLAERLSPTRKAGLALILAGAAVMLVRSGAAWNAERRFGDAMFLAASFLTACGTVVIRRAKLDPLHAAALVATGSLVVCLPVYLALRRTGVALLPLATLAPQAFFQGVVVTIVGMFLYARAVSILGALHAAAFGALVPALSALFAIPVLGEWPSGTAWAGIILVSAGVYCASGSGAGDLNVAGRRACSTAGRGRRRRDGRSVS